MGYWMIVNLAAGYNRKNYYPTVDEVRKAIAEHDHLNIFRWKNGLRDAPRTPAQIEVYNLMIGVMNHILNKSGGYPARVQSHEVVEPSPELIKAVRKVIEPLPNACRDMQHGKCENVDDCALKTARTIS